MAVDHLKAAYTLVKAADDSERAHEGQKRKEETPAFDRAGNVLGQEDQQDGSGNRQKENDAQKARHANTQMKITTAPNSISA